MKKAKSGNSAKILTAAIFVLMLISLISVFQVGTASAIGSKTLYVEAPENITIDGILDVGEWDDYWFTDSVGNEYFGGYPEFTYYKTNDEQDLYIAVIVNDPTPLEDANDDIWLAFRLDAGDDYKVFRKGYKEDPSEYGQLSETGAYGAYGSLPEGVEFGWSIDESHVYYEWKIPLALLGVNLGNTIKYLTHVREYPKPEGIPRPINYHPDATNFAPYPDITQFGDLTLTYPTIQSAINAASPGDTIEVAAGTYDEGSAYWLIDKPVSVIGAGSELVTIDRSASTSYGLNVRADNVRLQGFTFIGPLTASDWAYGLKIENSANLAIQDVRVISSRLTGIDLNAVTASTITNVVASGNGGTGVALTSCADVTITDLSTSNNAWGGVALFTSGSNINITQSEFTSESNVGIYVEGDATEDYQDISVIGNDFSKNPVQVADLVGGGVLDLEEILASNTFDRAVVVRDGGIKVPAIFSSIQDAIDAASPGDTIEVAAGTYNENINIDKSLTVRSVEGAENTIINAQEADMGVLINGAETVATFEGFTVGNFDTIGILAGAFTPTWGDDPDEVHILNNIVKPPMILGAHNNCIQVGDGTTGTVIGNEVSGAFLESEEWSGSGIIVAGSSDVVVSNNHVHNCESGIVILGYMYKEPDAPAVNNLVENNLVENCEAGISIEALVMDTTIENNWVRNNSEVGIQVYAYDNLWDKETSAPTGTEIHYNNVVGNGKGVVSGVWEGEHPTGIVAETVDATLQGNTFENNSVQVQDNAEVLNILDVAENNTFDCAVIVETASYLPFIWSSIQDAIDNASAGDTVLVYSGTYAEAITIGTDNLVLQSESELGAIIRPSTTPPTPPYYKGAAIYITADNVTVDGFEIDGTTVCNNGIYGWETSGLVIKNNKIHGAIKAWDGCGITLLSWGNSSTVYNNLIENNEVYDTGRMGIMVMDYGGAQNTYTVTSGNIITGNIVHDVWKVAWGDHGGGIQINVAENCSITNNEIYNVENGQRGIYMFGSATGNIITNNTIRDNPIGIQLWISGEGGTPIDWGVATPASPEVRYNNIYNNGFGAISSNIQGTPMVMNATLNYWGHPSGPGRDKGNGKGKGPGRGDRVSENVRYQPWLTKPFQTVLKKHVGHYGFKGAHLKEGWNTLSVPIYLDNNAWEETAACLDENIAYRFNASTQTWKLMTTDSKLDPLDAIYIRMNSEGIVPLAVSASHRCPPEKELKRGWNLVGLAVWEEENMSVDRALVSVELTPDGNRGYTIVVSPLLNQEPWAYTIGQTKEQRMRKNEAYWVYMENPDNLAGFSSTPLPFWEPE